MRKTVQWRSTGAGFTLLELLVVMLVIAIIASLVDFNVRGSERRLEIETQRLLGLTRLAVEEAILRNRQIGFQAYHVNDSDESGDGYRYFWTFWNGREWIPLNESPYELYNLPRDLELSVEVDDIVLSLEAKNSDSSVQVAPQLRFLSSGETDRFVIILADGTGGVEERIEANGQGDIRLIESDAA